IGNVNVFDSGAGTTIRGQTLTPEDFQVQAVSNGYQTIVMNQQPVFPLGPIVDVVGGRLTIDGDGQPTDGDTLTVVGSAMNDVVTINNSRISVNNTFPFNYTAANLSSINVKGLDGDDSVAIDSSGGAVRVRVTYDGGAGRDALRFSGGTATADSYTPGPSAGQGTSQLVIGGVTQTVSFSNLEPVVDLVAGSLTVNGTNGDNAI